VWFWLLHKQKLLINFFNKQKDPSSLRSMYRRIIRINRCVCDFFQVSTGMRVVLAAT